MENRRILMSIFVVASVALAWGSRYQTLGQYQGVAYIVNRWTGSMYEIYGTTIRPVLPEKPAEVKAASAVTMIPASTAENPEADNIFSDLKPIHKPANPSPKPKP